ARLLQHTLRRVTGEQRDPRVGGLHRLAEGRQTGLIIRPGPLIAYLPVFDPVRFGVPVLRPEPTHRRVRRPVGVFHPVGRGRRPFFGPPPADRRLAPDVPAELHDLFEPRAGGLESTPGAERLPPVRVADRIPPVELAEVRIVERATTKPD